MTTRDMNHPIMKEIDRHDKENLYVYGSCQYDSLAAIVCYAIDNNLTIEQLAESLELNLKAPVTIRQDHEKWTINDYHKYFWAEILDEEDWPDFHEAFPPDKLKELAIKNIPALFEFEKDIGSDLWSSASIADDFLTIDTEPFESNYKLVSVEGYFENKWLAVSNSYGLWYETAEEALGLYALIVMGLVDRDNHTEVYGGFAT